MKLYKQNKGFTLVELLAVIVILAILVLLAVPSVIKMLDGAKENAFKVEAENIIKGASLKYSNDMLYSTPKTCYSLSELSDFIDKDFTGYNGSVSIDTNNNTYTIYLSNGKYLIDGSIKGDLNLIESETTASDNCDSALVYKEPMLNGAYPRLDTGMIPVNISPTGAVTKADMTADTWYSYEDKKWANVVLVSNGSRGRYQSANVGEPITTSDILAYFVWIPRYKYEIFFDGNILMDQDYNTNTVELINITFENKNTAKSNGSWLTHPAFTFGSEELNGFWVGKFETTPTPGSLCATSQSAANCLDENPTILPGIASLRNQNVSTQFATSEKFKTTGTYGLVSTDSHMMKNFEWGAVAYLATSNYGQGTTEIRINNSSQYITGCAASTPATTKAVTEYLSQSNGSEGYYDGCENAYNTTVGHLASTTGNIYGIYDMSGGSWEQVIGVMQDSTNTNTPMSGYSTMYNSGYNGLNGDATAKTDGTAFPDTKYYDLYNYGTTNRDIAAYERGKLGDATIELGSFTKYTSGRERPYSTWNKDYANFVYSSYPWIKRGGNFDNGSGSGVFAFEHASGPVSIGNSFRTVLAN